MPGVHDALSARIAEDAGFDTITAAGFAATGSLLGQPDSSQLTANEMGTFYRYGAKPIFLVVNNGGFHAERVTNRFPDQEYNDLAKWNFADIPAAMGCKDWFTARVSTLGELDA